MDQCTGRLALLTSVLVALGCGAGQVVVPALDASTGPNADAGPLPDADAGPDAASAADAGATPDTGAATGLVALWRMDEGAGATLADSSGNGHTVALSGGATWTQAPRGGAVRFDGTTGYGSSTFSGHLPRFTVATWLNGANSPGTTQNVHPITKQENFIFSWDHTDSRYVAAAALRVNGTWYPASFGPLQAGRWYHLAATYDGAALRAYRDGQLVTSTATAGGDADSSTHTVQLARHPVELTYFAGALGETRLYDRPLSASEIADLAGAPVGCDPGLTDCGAGVCADLTRDSQHCGRCDLACSGGQYCSASACVPLPTTGSEVFVAPPPEGDDANPGTELLPFATPARAQQAIRALKAGAGIPANCAAVTLRQGAYHLGQTLTLSAADSGTDASHCVVWRADPAAPAGSVRLSGAVRVTGWQLLTSGSGVAGNPWSRLPAAAQGNVWFARLSGVDLTNGLSVRAWHGGAGETRDFLPLAELFFDGAPTILARWPDVNSDGTLGWHPIAGGNGDTTIAYTGTTQPSRWTQALAQPTVNKPWIHFYMTDGWADGTGELAALDTGAGVLTMSSGAALLHLTLYRVWYAMNLVEELGAAGEYWIDRVNGYAYFYPPSDPNAGEAVVSTLPTVLSVGADAQWIRFEGLTFESAQKHLLDVGGRNVAFSRCTLRNAAGSVRIWGDASGLDHCTISGMGDSGVNLGSGDLGTGVYVTNTDIHRWGRWSHTNAAGVYLFGARNRVENNEIHHGPWDGVLVARGPGHLVKRNEFHHTQQEGADNGAIYLNGYYTNTGGAQIVENYIHDIPGSSMSTYGQQGVYLDDSTYDATVIGNLLYRTPRAGIMQKGPRNVVKNNLGARLRHFFVPAFDSGNKVPGSVTGTVFSHNQGFANSAFAVEDQFTGDVFTAEQLAASVGTSGQCISRSGVCCSVSTYAEVAANVTDQDPGFVDEANGNLATAPDGTTHAAAFESGYAIPFSLIGIQP